jgi:hypothetical protein
LGAGGRRSEKSSDVLSALFRSKTRSSGHLRVGVRGVVVRQRDDGAGGGGGDVARLELGLQIRRVGTPRSAAGPDRAGFGPGDEHRVRLGPFVIVIVVLVLLVVVFPGVSGTTGEDGGLGLLRLARRGRRGEVGGTAKEVKEVLTHLSSLGVVEEAQRRARGGSRSGGSGKHVAVFEDGVRDC